MVRIDKKHQGNTISFEASPTIEGSRVNVRIVSVNGVECTSKRVLRKVLISEVVEYLRTVKPDQPYLIYHKVHQRIEPNKPVKKVMFYFKTRTLYLEKWNTASKKWVRMARSCFANDLRQKMYGIDDGMKYRIEEGRAMNVKIPVEDLQKAYARGMVKVDESDRPTMRKANGRSLKVVKAQQKMHGVRVKGYKL